MLKRSVLCSAKIEAHSVFADTSVCSHHSYIANTLSYMFQLLIVTVSLPYFGGMCTE